MSETIVRRRCGELRRSFLNRYPGTRAYYASKAFQTLDMLRIIRDEGLGVDVVSDGELRAALKAGVAPSDIIFHGNAKTDHELSMAVEAGVGRIAVDNLEELYGIEREAARVGKTQTISFPRDTRRRQPHTQVHFHGISIRISATASPTAATPYIEASGPVPCGFAGLHFQSVAACGEHFAPGALRVVLGLAARIARALGLEVRELNWGRGMESAICQRTGRLHSPNSSTP